ncbi:MAG: hypothetical protein KatS3mg073_0973 [Meiothermus sp.]|nr:MAG: hypothetical protein KatS3mg073_0973 [Meiothermus sp.]
MKIWHVCDTSGPDEVNGVSTTLWAIAPAQAALGHRVQIVSRDPLNAVGQTALEQAGLEHRFLPRKNLGWDSTTLAGLLDRFEPDVVHMHSVFIPQQYQLARVLRARGIPFIITPHGQLSSQSLRRGRLKKWPYARFIEKPRFYLAAAITALTAGEAADIKAFVPGFKGMVQVIPNPAPPIKEVVWQGGESKTLVYLGRFDVMQKGIDYLIALAGELPEYEFRLYGTEDAKTLRWLNRLKETASSNVHFEAPVFGEHKLAVLSQAKAYIQLSRWEGFGMSVLEAMSVGTPCLVSSGLQMTQTLQEAGLALPLSGNSAQMAQQVRNYLSDPAALARWSERARDYCRTELSPIRIATQYIELYQRVVVR